MTFHTRFGSLADFKKGGVEVIDDDPRHYVFSNVFDVASRSKPWERVCVAKNFEYVIEAASARGESPYWTARHDEFVLCMDGEVEVELHKLDAPAPAIDPTGESPRPTGKAGGVPTPRDSAAPIANRDGAHKLDALPPGKRMGRVVLRRGHMALLPKHSAYRLRAGAPSAVVFQTIEGPETILRWAEICQTEGAAP